MKCSWLLATAVYSAVAVFSTNAIAKDKWMSVRSENFFLIGNASEHDIRQTATKLEQFREMFSRLLPKLKLNSGVPITVIVFKSDAAYKPFKPLYQGKPANVGGYFQAGQDANYITLTSERREETPYAAIFHEYVHFLSRDNTRYSLPWVGEGLAEYYSTFEVSDGEKKVWLGKAIGHHVLLLRENKLLPLSVLFSVDRQSPYYNEKDKQGVFYAESWALVHYLMLGNKRSRQPQFVRYLSLLASGKPVDQSFRQAFETEYTTIEKEVKDYISHTAYPAQIISFDEKLEFESEMRVASVTEAETQYYLGDLLLHLQRIDEAEAYLKQAVSLDPKLVAAQASLGSLCAQQQRWTETKQYLQQAVEGDSKSYLAHYRYAELLSREPVSKGQIAVQFSPEKAQRMRTELRKAIELQPSFLESYRLMAYVSLVTGEDLDSSLTLLKRAQTISPGREEIDLDLGQIYLRKDDLATARRLLEPIAQHSSQAHLQSQAQMLLQNIDSTLEQKALFEAARQERPPQQAEVDEPIVRDSESRAPKLSHGTKTRSEKPSETLRVSPFPSGEKAAGLLIRIECLEKGLAFVVKSGNRLLKFYCEDPERILLLNAKQESLGTVTMSCGPRTPASQVVATFRKPTYADSSFDGDLLSLIFAAE